MTIKFILEVAMQKQGHTRIDFPHFNILLADKHVMFRRAIRRILQSMVDVEVVGEARDGFEVLEFLKKTSPQLIILGISMPYLRGLEAIREIKIINPEVKVLILTMHREMEYMEYALSAGAEGYLLKEDSDRELITAIDTLKKGGTYISPLLSTQLVDLLVRKSRPKTKQPEKPKELLTNRERMIIKLVAEGKSNKEIGQVLFISRKTVEQHRAHILKKLNLKKTADLIRYAIDNGYITRSS
jgi:DNA-binding NarL/FixJ family response regulator